MEERPPPDPAKLLAYWMEWEKGDMTPGTIMKNLKTGGLRELLEAMVAPPLPDTDGGARWGPGDPAAGRRATRGPPPWASLPPERRRVTADDVARSVRRLGTPTPICGWCSAGERPSAVLIPIYDEGDSAVVVMTRRARHLRSHKGEVSFPGGRQEPGETPLEAALRESQEETGLPPGEVEIVGDLDPLATFSSHSLIVPYVGLLAKRPDLVAHEAEVEAILHVPLAELLHDDAFREEQWRFAEGYHPLYFFEIVGDTIWGATARILHQLLSLVTGTGR